MKQLRKKLKKIEKKNLVIQKKVVFLYQKKETNKQQLITIKTTTVMRLTENNRELKFYTLDTYRANNMMVIQRETGESLYKIGNELGVPFVWTPVGNRNGDAKIIASILVLTDDRKNILVCSPNTNPTPIKDVPYIFTEFSEAAKFLSDKNFIPEYSDEDEISDVVRCERVVYLPSIDDIFEDEDKDEDEDEGEIEIDIEILMVIKLLARIIAKM